MEESERYCRKCELAKQYGGGLEEYLLRYLAQLTPEEQAEDVTYARRLACCGKCTWYGEHMCRACGCYVQLRAAVKGQNCPYEKWEQEGVSTQTLSCPLHRLCYRYIQSWSLLLPRLPLFLPRLSWHCRVCCGGCCMYCLYTGIPCTSSFYGRLP